MSPPHRWEAVKSLQPVPLSTTARLASLKMKLKRQPTGTKSKCGPLAYLNPR
jgi:hypothetical protein